MATKTKKTASGSARRPRAADDNAERVRQIGQSASQVVKEASLLLNEELAAGIVAARQMQQRFEKERRIDPVDFKDALQRFQRDGHEVINLLSDQVSDLNSDETAQRIKQIVDNGHNALDLFVELAKTGSEVMNQLVQSNLKKNDDSN
ncbi:hypothetical protein PQR33_35980 [Paraburkholderia sediminicola]|uniref:hypothetical protein n=1 Tax=Paraburkholderia sediminicola TaxID=458836 RepID=UPI0038B74C6B